MALVLTALWALAANGKRIAVADGGGAVVENSEHITYGSDNNAGLKRFDYGLSGLAGLEVSHPDGKRKLWPVTG